MVKNYSVFEGQRETIGPESTRGHKMADEELESELERLKKAKVVSEETAAVYLSHVRKLLNEGSTEGQKEEK